MWKFLINVRPLSFLNSLRYSIIRKIETFNYERSGDELAYSLTHPNFYNFEKKQKELLFGILKYAKENVPYYKMIMNHIDLDKEFIINNIKNIPLLSKAMIREQGKNIYSDQFAEVFRYWQKTGGSTGEPLEFPISRHFEDMHARCLYNLMGANKSDTIVALDGTRIEENLLEKKIFWKEGVNFPYGSTHYSTLHLNNDNMKYYVNHLSIIKPHIMRGYPSGFENLAKYMISKNIKFNFELKGIYLTSEFFDSSLTDLLRKAFCCPIFGQYGHSEVSVFAFTLADSLEYICSPLYGFTEVLDEEGNHVKNGELGEIVVTGYSNKVMPFIRYMTGDMAIYGGTQNGVVKLKSLQGRSVDYIVGIDNKKIYLVGLIFGSHLNSFAKIKCWQIEQSDPGFITVKIVKDLGFSDKAENEIVKLFKSVGITTNINYVDEIPLTSRGKRKFLVQNIN